MILKVAIVKGLIPSYREGFYDKLFAKEELSVHVFCQPKIKGLNLRSIHKKYGDKVSIVKYWELDGGKLTWQFLPWRKIFSNYDVVFVEGNPRNVSHFLLATFLKILNKKVVLWTMAHSYRANQTTEKIRLWWSKIFKYLFVYTDDEVRFLRERGYREQTIIGMNNGLDQKKIDTAKLEWTDERINEWLSSRNMHGREIILSCSRLDKKNQFELIVEALPQIIQNKGNVLWCVIGAGDEKEHLQKLITDKGLNDFVRFAGEIYNEAELAPWFMVSELLIHPAAIGLTTLHAFGYGLPVITHGNSVFHGPEFAAFKEGETGYTYKQDDSENMAEKVIKLLQNKEELACMKAVALKIAREDYNIDVMANRFVEISRIANKQKY